MFENKEIKLNKEAFDIAISKLTEYRDTLVKAKDNILLVNNNIKKEWLGVGGDTFLVHANALECRLFERISDLLKEINDINIAKESMFNEDKHLADKIDDKFVTL